MNVVKLMKLKSLFICILVLFIVSGCNFNKYNDYKTISKYVNENYNDLYKIAKESINGNKIEYKKEIKRISVYKEYKTIVEFSMGGSGMVPSSTYIGFNYSKNDIPAAFQNEKFDLKEIEKNKWEWKEDGDNHGITIKIRDNWYYYEASF